MKKCILNSLFFVSLQANINPFAYVALQIKRHKDKEALAFILVSENRQLEEALRVKSQCSRPMAWAFTRIWCNGVWRYLRNVDEVISPRFFIVYTLDFWTTDKNYK